MNQICDECPVQRECATWVSERISLGRIVGGFYAGVWLPWPKQADTITSSIGRRRARDTLRRKALDSTSREVFAGQHQCVRGPG